MRMVLAKEVAAERDTAARFIPWLATFGSVSPLLGLLGTVLGVMDAFIGIAVGGSGNITAVAPGVAEALVTTVGGLAVAVPAVMAYNLFVNRSRASHRRSSGPSPGKDGSKWPGYLAQAAEDCAGTASCRSMPTSM
jgi:biopolymer transport protein ExbB/TolQ